MISAAPNHHPGSITGERCLIHSLLIRRWSVVLVTAALATTTLVGGVAAERIPWTVSRVVGSPDPPAPYRAQRIWPGVRFDEPVELEYLPGTGRLVVVERKGKIWTVHPDQLVARVTQVSDPAEPQEQPEAGEPAQPARSVRSVAGVDLAADLERDLPGLRQIYGFTFHPNFQENRQCFVCYVRDDGLPEGSRVVRMTVTDEPVPRIDPRTEQLVFSWPSGGHNGGCLRFGPDGYLYISTGDAVGPNPPDTLRTGQDCSDLLSSILRIDVDHADPEKTYGVPADNPFVGQPGIRPEIWAYGFRNPWKMSFAPRTGDLWVGDVGWELWELVFRVERGGNYGWSVMEGRQPTNPEWPRGPTPILPPAVDHPHTEAASITGGYVYQGHRYPELRDTLIYGDFETGKIWSLRYEQDRVIELRELADTSLRIIAFGQDQAGEQLIADYYGGGIYQLVPNTSSNEPADFPQRLSDTGLFANTQSLEPSPGVVPFEVIHPAWFDGTSSEYWLGVPGNGVLDERPGESLWNLPADSVLVKTVYQAGDAAQDAPARRLETQLLHFLGDEWRAYVYAWDDDQQDARLVPSEGATRTLEIADRPGGRDRRLLWRHAARAECLRCHNRAAGVTLGLRREQLDPSQLDRFFRAGLFDRRPEPSGWQLARRDDAERPLEQRARSYLHANCGHCHRDGGGSAAILKLHYDVPLSRANLLGNRPSLGTFGIPEAELIAPGDAARSVVVFRMATLGGGRMPHIGSRVVDLAGLNLVREWINQLSKVDPSDVDLEFDPQQVLELTGDVERGRHLFQQSGSLQCRSCHQVAGVGVDVGPDLSQIGKKYGRSQLLEQIVAPSRQIDPAYLAHVVETSAGQVFTGLLRRRDEQGVTVQTADGQHHELAASDIERLAVQGQSLMPDGVVQQLSAQELADLLAYLLSLSDK
jgi:putative heme-binding domain-containing protein